MQVQTVTVGPIGTNCYVAEDGGELLVVDPGAQPRLILDAIAERPVRYIVLTHRHWDHIGALCDVAEATGAPIAAGVADAEAIENPDPGTLAKLPGYTHPVVDVRLGDGDELVVGSCTLHAFETPGHTEGSICLYCAGEGVLFAGDTVFSGGRFGRTDLPTGDMGQMEDSLRKLGELVPGDTKVYCGHEGPTTMEREKKLNRYMA